MSANQPPSDSGPGSGPGADSGPEPDGDPFRKRPGGPPPAGEPPGATPPGGGPYGSPPPPPPPGPEGHAGGGYGYGPGYGAPDPAPAGMPPLAGSGRRLVARIIDALIIGIPVNILLSLAGILDWSADADNMAFGASLGGSALSSLVYFVYEGYLLTTRGQTLGKMWLGIRVAMLADGSVPAGAAGWIRALVYGVCGWICCLWPVNVLWHLFDRPYRQCLHDKAARTVVVVAR